MAKKVSKAQADWLNAIAGSAAALTRDSQRLDRRQQVMDGIEKELEKIRDGLAAASSLEVTWTKDKVDPGTYRPGDTPEKDRPVTRRMNWSEANAKTPVKGSQDSDRMIRDIEVDTRHDLKKGYRVDEKKAQALQKEHQKVVELQRRMELAVDDDGKPLFSARDIERDLWSPLVKSDVIPSNAVADRYSQEAQAFTGGVKIYQDMLEKHSETASKHEKALRGLRIAKDTVQLMGTAASQAVKIANFSGASMSGKEGRELKILTDRSEGVGDPLTEAEELRFEALGNQYASQVAGELGEAGVALAVGVLNGVIDLSGKALEKPDSKRNWELAEMAFTLALETASSAVGTMLAKNKASSDPSFDVKNIGMASDNLIKYAMHGGKVVFRFREALEAGPEDRKAAVMAMIGSVASAVGSAFAAFDKQAQRDERDNISDPGTAGKWAKIGAGVSAGIASSANVGAIIKEIADARSEGRAPNMKLIVGSLGMNVLAAVAMGTYEVAADGARQLKGDDTLETSPNQETGYERSYRKQDDPAALQEFAEAMQAASEAFEDMEELPDVDDLAVSAAREASKRAEAETRAEIKALADRVKNDDAFRKSLEEDLRQAEAEASAEIMADIAVASIPPSDLGDPQRQIEAHAALDRLMAEITASNQKWQMIETITAGGVGMIAKFAPGGGLVVAIRQLASDVAQLLKKSVELNTWIKNMALTYGNDSVYGPAISSRLGNAKVQVSQKAANVVFSMIDVAAESMRLADVMGAATATAIANSLARALTDYGYKMQKEIEIEMGWRLYKQARSPEGAGDRKLARKAMSWNSTLSKCVLAYGIVKDADPVAAEVARKCGLTPAVLEDQHDVCQKVVQYFMLVYSDDPVVVRRVPITRDWHPGTLELSFDSWMRFKAAAAVKAIPPLAKASLRSRKVDDALAGLSALFGKKDYQTALNRTPPRKQADFLEQAEALLDRVIEGTGEYQPLCGPKEEGLAEDWDEGDAHEGMASVASSLEAQAIALRTEVRFDLKGLPANGGGGDDSDDDDDDGSGGPDDGQSSSGGVSSTGGATGRRRERPLPPREVAVTGQLPDDSDGSDPEPVIPQKGDLPDTGPGRPRPRGLAMSGHRKPVPKPGGPTSQDGGGDQSGEGPSKVTPVK